MPGPYLVVRIEDKAAGIGNELPGVITGKPPQSSPQFLHPLPLQGHDIVTLSLSHVRALRKRLER